MIRLQDIQRISEEEKQRNQSTVTESDLYKRIQAIATGEDEIETEENALTVPSETRDEDDGSFFSDTIDDFRSFGRRDISITDVLQEIPSATGEVAGNIKDFSITAADTLIPSIKNFFETTGGIFGEGLAYAIDPNVREQFKAGNLDVLPTISDTTTWDMAKYTFATGLETAIFRSLPDYAKLKLWQRGGVGAIEGVGFGIAEGISRDKSPEEIVDSLPVYGVLGGSAGIIAPHLIPLLKSEIGTLPTNIKNVFKQLGSEVRKPKPTKLKVIGNEEPTRVPINTPNKQYEQYLRSQGYEPYVPDDELPTIKFGQKARTEGIPAEDLEPPRVFGSSPTVKERIDQLGTKDRSQVINNTRKLFGQGMDYDVAEETALLRFESSKRTKGRGESKFIPEESVTRRTQRDTPGGEPVSDVSVTRRDTRRADITTTSGDTPIETRTTRVSSDQLPVGEGQVKASRLEARIRNDIESPVTAQRAMDEGINYQQMNEGDQLRRASEYVANTSDDEIMAVIRGDRTPPDGLLNNSIMLAMQEKMIETGNRNLDLVTRLGSLRATRMGQEIDILKHADQHDPFRAMKEIIEARRTRAQRKLGKGKDIDKQITKDTNDAAKRVSKERVKIEEAEKILDELAC